MVLDEETTCWPNGASIFPKLACSFSVRRSPVGTLVSSSA